MLMSRKPAVKVSETEKGKIKILLNPLDAKRLRVYLGQSSYPATVDILGGVEGMTSDEVDKIDHLLFEMYDVLDECLGYTEDKMDYLNPNVPTEEGDY